VLVSTPPRYQPPGPRRARGPTRPADRQHVFAGGAGIDDRRATRRRV